MITLFKKYIFIPLLLFFAKPSIAAADALSPEMLQQLIQRLQSNEAQNILNPEEEEAEVKAILNQFIRKQEEEETALDGIRAGYQQLFGETALPFFCLSLIIFALVFAESAYRFFHTKEKTPLVYISFLFYPSVAIIQGGFYAFGDGDQTFLVPICASVLLLLLGCLFTFTTEQGIRNATISLADICLFTFCLFVGAYFAVAKDCEKKGRLPFATNPHNVEQTMMEAWKEEPTNQSFGVKVTYFLVEGWAKASTAFNFREKKRELVSKYEGEVERVLGKVKGKRDFYTSLITHKHKIADAFFLGVEGDLEEAKQNLSLINGADKLKQEVNNLQIKLNTMKKTFNKKYEEAEAAMKLGDDRQEAYSKVIDLQITHKGAFEKELERTIKGVNRKLDATS